MLNTEHNAYFGGGQGRPADTNLSFADAMSLSEFNFTTLPTASNYALDHYVIESPTDVYLVERMRLKSSNPPPLVTNMPVKFAVSKNKLWLVDEDGKELQTNIAKRKPKFQPTQ